MAWRDMTDDVGCTNKVCCVCDGRRRKRGGAKRSVHARTGEEERASACTPMRQCIMRVCVCTRARVSFLLVPDIISVN